jgi:hypothetical protein
MVADFSTRNESPSTAWGTTIIRSVRRGEVDRRMCLKTGW